MNSLTHSHCGDIPKQSLVVCCLIRSSSGLTGNGRPENGKPIIANFQTAENAEPGNGKSFQKVENGRVTALAFTFVFFAPPFFTF